MLRQCTTIIQVDSENLFNCFSTKEGELMAGKYQTVSFSKDL